MNKSDKILNNLIMNSPSIELPPPSGIALGYMMRDWLRNTMADSDTAVDSAAGQGEFDLWVTVEGIEYYINIRQKSNISR